MPVIIIAEMVHTHTLVHSLLDEHVRICLYTRRYIDNETQRRRHTPTSKFNIANTNTHVQTQTLANFTCDSKHTRTHVSTMRHEYMWKTPDGINNQTYQDTRKTRQHGKGQKGTNTPTQDGKSPTIANSKKKRSNNKREKAH